jgi:hypothetical protein
LRGHGEFGRGEANPGCIAVSAMHQAAILVQRGLKKASTKLIFNIFSQQTVESC